MSAAQQTVFAPEEGGENRWAIGLLSFSDLGFSPTSPRGGFFRYRKERSMKGFSNDAMHHHWVLFWREKKTEKSAPHWERKEKTAVNDQLCTSFLDGRLRVKAYEHRLCDWLRRISISSLKVIRAAFAHAMNESESSPSSFPGYAVSSTFASSSAFDSSTAQRFWSPV